MSLVIKSHDSIITERISLSLVCIYLNTFYLGERTRTLENWKANKEAQKELTVDTSLKNIIHTHLSQYTKVKYKYYYLSWGCQIQGHLGCRWVSPAFLNSRLLGTEEHSSCTAGLRGEAFSAASFKMGSFLPDSHQPSKLERCESSGGVASETLGRTSLQKRCSEGWDRGGHGKHLSYLNLPQAPPPKVVLLQMPFIKTLDLAFNKAAQNVGRDPSGTQGQRKVNKKGVLFMGFLPP